VLTFIVTITGGLCAVSSYCDYHEEVYLQC
jgi:hypothetical protein